VPGPTKLVIACPGSWCHCPREDSRFGSARIVDVAKRDAVLVVDVVINADEFLRQVSAGRQFVKTRGVVVLSGRDSLKE